ncbi:MAG: SRPBCC family protein, partial [Kineosporiaceae bacterium]
MVTDIDLPARFSNEFLGAAWATDERSVGAVFHGRNQHPAIGEWTVPCFVDTWEDRRSFGWRTSDADNPGARWRFDLEPLGDRTRLRFS